MTATKPRDQVRGILQSFQDGYTRRDLDQLDQFMKLFEPAPDVELIGIGASERGGEEWFVGIEAIREIIESDWRYWGDVILDVPGAEIWVHQDVAWLSTCGHLIQTPAADEALVFYLRQMADKLSEEAIDPPTRLMEATHYGMRRLWERHRGEGYRWPFVLTAVLVLSETGWRFRQVHFSMPVD